MIDFYDIHRHDEYSTFDGFGKPEEVVSYAKELGYRAIGSTNHGNISGLVKHYLACVKYDIIPILGCEAYFQPKIDNESKKYFHLCLFANSRQGWRNLNKLLSISNDDEHFYYKNRLSFDDLEKYSEGIMCSSACIAGFIPQCIKNGKMQLASKAVKKFQSIYDDRFFFEIMPVELDGEGEDVNNVQIKVNKELINLSKLHNVPVIVTSDSHYVKQEDFSTYLKMHEIKKTTIGSHYRERYMHKKEDMDRKIRNYHFEDLELIESGMNKFLEMIGDAREWFESGESHMPKYTDSPEATYALMRKKCIEKLKKEGKTSQEYRDRLKYEFDVIKYHGFQDYFMIVQDYVNWAKNNDIAVGPGRGSAGNSLTNYALGITEVDPIYFGNNFDRFLRKDKKKFPDIDVDFCQRRRDEVIEYIKQRYEGKAAQTLTYGTYNIKNLLNDLSKICGVKSQDEVKDIKKRLEKYCDDNEHTINEEIYKDKELNKYNSMYDNIIIHFTKMYGKIRFFGTHASSVILADEDISYLAALTRVGNNIRTSFDLRDIETLKLLKLDILGLSSASKVHELEVMTGEKFSYDMLRDKKTLKEFEKGNASVFQFESASANSIAKEIGIDSFEDVVVATSVNRPGPLSMNMHKKYKEAKNNPDTSSPWYKYTDQTYGALIYQEQGMSICKNIGKFDSESTDKIIKLDYLHIPSDKLKEWREIFYKGANEYGLTKQQTEELFNSLIQYSFNRGHGVAYAMLSVELMYFKVHYPLYFWYCTLKYENKEDRQIHQESLAVQSGCPILLPHVNAEVEYSIQNIDGDNVIQRGLVTIKNVGDKAAELIVEERKKNGKYHSVKEFKERVEGRAVNSRCVEALIQEGALDFNEQRFLRRCEQYNISLYQRRIKNGY